MKIKKLTEWYPRQIREELQKSQDSINRKKWKSRAHQKYGIPYTGNKQRIAQYIFEQLPAGKRFVDLFGGGGAMTHYALLHCKDKYESFLYNDINPLVTDLFQRAIQGEFNPQKFKPAFITREEYFRRHNEDGYVAYIWSFGNNNKGYLFGESVEEFKHHAHDYIVFGDKESLKYLEEHYKDSYYWHIKELYQDDDYVLARKMYVNIILKIEAIKVCRDYGDTQVYDKFKDLSFEEFFNLSKKRIVEAINKYCPNIPKKDYKSTKDKDKLNELIQLTQLQRFEGLQQLERLERLERLQRLQQLEQLEQLQQVQQVQQVQENKLTITNMSYENYTPQPGDVVYCDIPYDSDVKYEHEFDPKKFFEWAKKQTVPIYFSYYTPGEVLWNKKHRTSNIGKADVRYETLMKL